MAENEVSKATEKVERKDQGDRILKQIADDGVVGNDIQQELHSESKKFDNQHNLSDEALIASKEGELLEEYKKRVEEIQNNRFSITGLEDPAPPDKNDSMSTGQMLATGGRDAEMMLEAIGNLPPGEQSAAKKSLKFAYGHSISSSDCPMENLGSDSDGQRIAVSDEQLNRHELKSWRELQVPKDGQSITLKQILEDYKTPFIEAYNHSKQLKEGQSGKSKTLEDIVDRLRGCPWADDIQIKLDRKESNPEYDPERNTMTINPEDTPETQIELFSHEAYHATHQFLHKMYGGLVLGKQEFR
ncbi:MAG: hypothetical protein K8F91_00305, partial [Candidatus Obscuribacterales bacterium]|nr:hypothetical protein [Candidatus Obscuribacterales bacterium]